MRSALTAIAAVVILSGCGGAATTTSIATTGTTAAVTTKPHAESAAAARWHKGYKLFSDSLAYRWVNPKSVKCGSYEVYGCWEIEVITRDGCSYLEAEINELKGKTVVKDFIPNEGNVPPKKPVTFHIGADEAGVRLGPPYITCT